MELLRCDQHIVDKCRQCHGIWFDQGELSVFRERLSDLDLERSVTPVEAPQTSSDHQIFLCPRCQDPLVDTPYLYKTSVRLQRCDNCQGNWVPLKEVLGLFELEKIARSARRIRLTSPIHDVKRPKSQFSHHHLFPTVGIIAVLLFLLLPLASDKYKSRRFIGSKILILAIIFGFLFFKLPWIHFAPEAFAVAVADPQLWSFFSAFLLNHHALEILIHLFPIWVFARDIEEDEGPVKLLLAFTIIGVLSLMAEYFWCPKSMAYIMGSGGAVAGLMGCHAVLYPHARLRLLLFGGYSMIRSRYYVAGWFILQLVVVSINDSLLDFAWYAHIAGLLAGLLWGVSIKRMSTKKKRATA